MYYIFGGTLKLGLRCEKPSKHRMVAVEEIRRSGYDLCPPMYLSGYKYPDGVKTVKIEELFEITKGSSAASSALDEGKFHFSRHRFNPEDQRLAHFLGLLSAFLPYLPQGMGTHL